MSTREHLEGKVINNLHVERYLGSNKYICTCLICGNSRECRTYDLKLGKYKACKDCEKTPSLAGSTIGNWKLLHSSNKGYPYWECECLLCNKQYTVNIKNIKQGNSSCCTECANKLKTTDITTKQFKSGRVLKYLGSSYWECECGLCGEHIKRSITNLKSQDEIICNHCSGTKLQKDLSGKTFGNWKVLKRVEDGARYHSRWLCECLLCGKKSEVYTYNLISGNSKSCGCSTFIDLTGIQINDLHVDEYLGNQQWKCTCSCGKVTTVSGYDLRNGYAKSCGCKKWQYTREKLLIRYGEIAPCKISNPRTKEQIDAVEYRESLREFIENLNYKPTTYELSKLLGINICNTLRKIHGFSLDELVDIGSSMSKQHTEVLEFIYQFIDESEVIVNDRKLLNGKEIDIYIPSKKLAIEVNGVYWHSDIFKDKNYHQVKSILCGKHGVQLIHIFEHEWENSDTQEKIKTLLKSKLSTPDKIIYARKCIIDGIGTKEYAEFLDKWHIQNSVNTPIRIGCYYDNELVGVIGLGKPRFSSKYEYEILRLCWKGGIAVVGGIQKMFKYFLNKYKPNSILTYADLSKFNGKSYMNIGFKPVAGNAFSEPNYVWVRPVCDGVYDVLPRYRTQKHKLIKAGFGCEADTEDIIMERLGYLKIYNSGNIKYEWKSRW